MEIDPKIKCDIPKCLATKVLQVSLHFQAWINSFSVVKNELLKWQH